MPLTVASEHVSRSSGARPFRMEDFRKDGVVPRKAAIAQARGSPRGAYHDAPSRLH